VNRSGLACCYLEKLFVFFSFRFFSITFSFVGIVFAICPFNTSWEVVIILAIELKVNEFDWYFVSVWSKHNKQIPRNAVAAWAGLGNHAPADGNSFSFFLGKHGHNRGCSSDCWFGFAVVHGFR